MTTMTGRIRARAASSDDQGFTLVEVVVAMVLLTLVMTGLATFFVRGIGTANGLQRRDAAVSLADQTMEQVRAVPPGYDGNGLSKLVAGRTQAAVAAQWVGAPVELANTVQSYDTTATSASVPVLPLTTSQTVSNQAYKIDILIGTCNQPRTAAACSKTVSAALGVKMYRVVVRVAWSPGVGRTCSGTACQYLLTTLIDPNADQTFNSGYDVVAPVAVDDAVNTAMNTAVAITVLTNDTGTFNTTPVSVLTSPTKGVLSGATSSGTINYTPTVNTYGTDTFTYRLTDSSGQLSNIATVTITINRPAAPTAKAYTFATAAKTAISPAPNLVTGNTGTFAASGAATLISPSAAGGAVSAAGVFTYTPGVGVSGAQVFTYRLTDTTGQTATNTITVTVSKPAAPRVLLANNVLCNPSRGYSENVMQVFSGTDLSPSGLDDDTSQLNGWGVSAPSSTGVVSITATSSRTGYISYTITDPWGQTSGVARVTLQAPRC